MNAKNTIGNGKKFYALMADFFLFSHFSVDMYSYKHKHIYITELEFVIQFFN